MNKWIARIDAMKTEFELTSEAQAAKLLGISQQALSQIRKGQIEMGPLTKLALLNKLGAMSLRDALLEVLPAKKKAAAKKSLNRIHKKANFLPKDVDKES